MRAAARSGHSATGVRGEARAPEGFLKEPLPGCKPVPGGYVGLQKKKWASRSSKFHGVSHSSQELWEIKAIVREQEYMATYKVSLGSF